VASKIHWNNSSLVSTLCSYDNLRVWDPVNTVLNSACHCSQYFGKETLHSDNVTFQLKHSDDPSCYSYSCSYVYSSMISRGPTVHIAKMGFQMSPLISCGKVRFKKLITSDNHHTFGENRFGNYFILFMCIVTSLYREFLMMLKLIVNTLWFICEQNMLMAYWHA
jgi:hypothetical protein